MAKQEDVIATLALFHKNRPTHAFEELHKIEMGLFAVLRHLAMAVNAGRGGVSSKELSDALGVSSARMTVLLKKLEQKKLITKQSAPEDARAVRIALSAQGIALTQRVEQQMYQTAERVVDEFGIEELQTLMQKVAKIKTILHECRPIQWEEDYV